MRSRPPKWVVALDGGTTNTRARLLHEGNVVATARRAVGVRDTVLSGAGKNPLTAAVRDAIQAVLGAGDCTRPDAVVAAGMLGSEVGLTTVPHAFAPLGIDELARTSRVVELPEVSPWPILFVPGVRTPAKEGIDGWAEADVMRGEECETLGALSLVNPNGPIAMVWPGSHTKLVEVDSGGRILRSHTTLAGEMTGTLARHTLLAASLPTIFPVHPDPASLDSGARLVAREGLGRCAFLVRVAALTGAMEAEQRAAFWVGAMVADDASNLARHSILAHDVPVLVGGSQPLRDLYAARLAEVHRGSVSVLSDEDAERVSALGALAVVRRALEIEGREVSSG